MRAVSRLGWIAPIVFGLVSAGCGGGSDGADGPPGPQGPPGQGVDEGPGPYDPLPGMNIAIVGISGGSGPAGHVEPGDTIAVTFTCEADDGTPLDVFTLNRGAAYVSGPTTHYQRVIPSQGDVLASVVGNGNGTWTYTFPVPFPSTYAAPYNDTASFGPEDGEMTGEAVEDGTYSLALELRKDYEIEGETFRDAGVAVFDFLVGSADSIAEREVVSGDARNQCHNELRAHGNNRMGAKVCMLCHTAGAEDRNVPAAAGGTPGVSIDWRVMVHKIHNGVHLPSVLGVTTESNGARNYAATPVPYELVGFGDAVLDFSDVGFPVNPSAYTAYLFDAAGTTYTGPGGNGPMPRDAGYGALSGANKLKEDVIRSGVVACEKCHGGAAQGSNHKTVPTRQACGSCHDDVVWEHVYSANGTSMPPNLPNSTCAACHPEAGGALAVEDAHRHPYVDPAVNTGINLTVTGVAGGTGPGGKHQAGDPVVTTFSVRNDAAQDVSVHATTRGQAIVVGPTENPQVLAGNATLFDTTSWRKSSPFTGAGSITRTSVGAGALRQVYCAAFTGGNVFDFLGSASGPIQTGIVVPAGGSVQVSGAGLTFTVNDTGADFAAGDRFYLEVWPTASSYTMPIPTDPALERLGAVVTGSDVFAVANLPLYWGRQTVWERTALPGLAVVLQESAARLGRYVVCDATAFGGLAVPDRVVLDAGTANEEYLQVGWIQTTDEKTGLDLGTADRIWFTTSLRFDHVSGAYAQECTLTGRREGVHYTVGGVDVEGRSGTGQLTLLPGAWTAGNPVVATYRTDVRFGRRRFPGDALQAYYPDCMQDTDGSDMSWGDWKGLPFLDGTYRVGFWINRDYNVTTTGGESTPYRMINPPSVKDFLFGAATTITAPQAIADLAVCDRCHDQVTSHGNGRRGLETCFMCHRTSGIEDDAKYTVSGSNLFANYYVGSTPGVTMDFRTMVHKIHMGKEMPKASTYTMVGVFLGVPYNQKVDSFGYPWMPAGTSDCASCHGNDAWVAPAPRVHPAAALPTRTWRAVCGSCHDADFATAHIDVNSSISGYESCDVCHGPGRDVDVVKVHVPRPR